MLIPCVYAYGLPVLGLQEKAGTPYLYVAESTRQLARLDCLARRLRRPMPMPDLERDLRHSLRLPLALTVPSDHCLVGCLMFSQLRLHGGSK